MLHPTAVIAAIRRHLTWKRGTGLLILLTAFSALLVSGAPAPNNGEILVSAAISLKGAFTEIGALYEKQTGVKVRFNFGASGLLQKQLEAGAPVDVLASASERQMDALQTQGLLLAETRCNFAGNTLVLIVPKNSKLPMHAFQDLARSGIGRLAIGNPKTVPAGQYAQEALSTLKLWDALQPRLVLAENVRQVTDYVGRGEVDAGIVYASDLPAASAGISVAAQAPKNLHTPILYPIAVIKGSREAGASRRFIHLVCSNTGLAILKKHGFLDAK